jgi:hypothetical protein
MSKLTLQIGASISGLQSGLNSAKNAVSKFGAGIKSAISGVGGTIAGLVGVGSLIAFGKAAIDSADQVADGSKRIGVSAEQYQKLRYAAEQSGAGIESIEAGFKKMSSTVTDANSGNQTAIATINSLGVSMDELAGKSPNEIFEIMADALSQVSDSTKQASLAQDIFGKGGMSLIPLLGTYKELGQEIQNAGGIMSNEAVAAADAFNDSMNKLGTTLKAVVVNSGLAEYLKTISEEFNALTANADKFAKSQNVAVKSKKTPDYINALKYTPLAFVASAYEMSKDKMGAGITSSPAITKSELSAKKSADEKAKKDKKDRESAAAAFSENAAAQKDIDKLSKEAADNEMAKMDAEIKGNEAVSGAIAELQKKISIQKLINDGKEKEAAIQEAINDAEEKAGRALTDKEKAKITTGTGDLFDLNKKKTSDAYNPMLTDAVTSTDAVKRIGGSIGGASNVNFAKDQLAVQKEISTVLKQVKENMITTQAGQVWP